MYVLCHKIFVAFFTANTSRLDTNACDQQLINNLIHCIYAKICLPPANLDTRQCRRTLIGAEYLGTQMKTPSGKTCLHWIDYQDKLSNSTYFMDSINKSVNYCRNPDGDVKGPWCFTGPESRESCAIVFCGKTMVHHYV